MIKETRRVKHIPNIFLRLKLAQTNSTLFDVILCVSCSCISIFIVIHTLLHPLVFMSQSVSLDGRLCCSSIRRSRVPAMSVMMNKPEVFFDGPRSSQLGMVIKGRQIRMKVWKDSRHKKISSRNWKQIMPRVMMMRLLSKSNTRRMQTKIQRKCQCQVNDHL